MIYDILPSPVAARRLIQLYVAFALRPLAAYATLPLRSNELATGQHTIPFGVTDVLIHHRWLAFFRLPLLHRKSNDRRMYQMFMMRDVSYS